MINCAICNKELHKINLHLIKVHNIYCKEYLSKFSESKLEDAETHNKRIISNIGLKRNKETKEKMSLSRKLFLSSKIGKKQIIIAAKLGGQKSASNRRGKTLEDIFGLQVANSIINSISKANKGRVPALKGKTWDEYYGLNRSLEMKKNISKKTIGHKNCNPNGWGKSFVRKDLDQFFRSTWEANFARILNYIGIKWEYEKHRIFLEGCSYLPDFYLPELSLYVEVKGKFKDEKLGTLFDNYPNFPIKILDHTSYKILTNQYHNIVLGWEK